MTQKDLDQLSVEELNSKLKALKTATSIFVSVLAVLIGVTGYAIISKGDITPITVVPIVLAPLAVMNIKKIKMMQSEISKRPSQS